MNKPKPRITGKRLRGSYREKYGMNIPELLNGAADHVDAFGHHKGSAFADPSHFHTSPACLLGAFGAVCGDDEELMGEAIMVMDRFLGRHPITFNDDPETSGEQVVEALRAAAIVAAASEVDVLVVAS